MTAQPATSKVVARLTVMRLNGMRLIIEVRTDASFHSFYQHYEQIGNRWSTKTPVCTSSRNEGLRPWHKACRMEPGLEVLADQFRKRMAVSCGLSSIVSVKLRIVSRRAYRALLTVAPDVLGMVKAESVPDPRLLPRPALRFPVRIPEGHTTIARKWSILTGRG